MTREEAIAVLENEIKCVDKDCNIERSCGSCSYAMPSKEPILEAYRLAIETLEQEPCEDAISRQAVLDKIKVVCFSREQEWVDFRVSQGSYGLRDFIINFIEYLPSVQPKSKTGHCKDCKYFEYDSVAMVGGIPLIVAHEFCSRWGLGCKTKEDGYCFMYEPQESEES